MHERIWWLPVKNGYLSLQKEADPSGMLRTNQIEPPHVPRPSHSAELSAWTTGVLWCKCFVFLCTMFEWRLCITFKTLFYSRDMGDIWRSDFRWGNLLLLSTVLVKRKYQKSYAAKNTLLGPWHFTGTIFQSLHTVKIDCKIMLNFILPLLFFTFGLLIALEIVNLFYVQVQPLETKTVWNWY